jgi:Icc-related predicted phosphoesterase
MQWIVLADVHGSVRYLPFIVPELSRAQGVFIAGDITNFGGRREAAQMIDSIAAVNGNIVAVAGNCDPEGVAQFLEERGMTAHGTAQAQGTLCCVGVNGSLSGEQGEAAFTRVLEQAVSSHTHGASQLVVLSHQPAYGTAVDALRGGAYCGSKAIRQFIEAREPILAISGHIHEASGVDRLGKTTLVNPGPFRSGQYAVVTWEDGHLAVQLKRASD